MGKKGQITIEYILMVGLLIIFLLSMYYFLDKQVLEEKRLTKIDIYINRIEQNANVLNSLEDDSSRIIVMNIPLINSITFQNYQMIINTSIHSNLLIKSTTQNITGRYDLKNTSTMQLTKKNGYITAKNV